MYTRLVKHKVCYHVFVACLSLLSYSSYSQDKVDKLLSFPTSFFNTINRQSSALEKRLTKQTDKYLHRLARQEKKLHRKLAAIDSTGAQQLFGDSDAQYEKLREKLKDTSTYTLRGEYLPGMDSIKTSLAFLQQHNHLLGNAKDIQGKVQGSLQNVQRLQSKVQQGEQVKAFIQQRKRQIKEALGKYTQLTKSITNGMADFNRQAYYYGQQIKEFKDLLKEPDKMVTKGLALLNKLPAFQQFMKQNGELASLFRLPDNYGTPQSMAGLQTRAQVQSLIQTQLASGGPNATQYLQQNLQAAQAQLNTLKDKINQLGGSGDMDMPHFKPDIQKTKTFWNRLEYGTNIQSARSSYFLPTTTDLALSAGYKLSDKSTIGVGASYKMGWGKDIRHIAITNEGMGLRSFIDIKIKGSFYASGGFEYNYQPIRIAPPTPTTDVADAWQRSGLVGMSKIISVKSNFFKKTKLQWLWDFLSYQQVPRAQPVKFRVGYNF